MPRPIAVLTTDRTAEFMPGLSPPLHSTAKDFIVFVLASIVSGHCWVVYVAPIVVHLG